MIPIFDVKIYDNTINAVVELLQSGRISSGKVNDEFESRLKKEFGINNLFTVNSGTSALHLALLMAGVQSDDEVIVPSQSFVATGLAVLYCGAKVVFCDIDSETGNINVENIKALITHKTKAIVPVHWGGYPCDLEEINDIARRYGLIVIEDAAHALGATYKGIPIGNYSYYTAFSFQAIKSLTTGDGGAIATLLPSEEVRGKRLRWFGIDRDKSVPGPHGEREYDLEELGYKYHLNDIAATIGIKQLDYFYEDLERRRKIAKIYTEILQEAENLDLVPLNYKPDRQSSFWLYPILVKTSKIKRNEFIDEMKKAGIETSVVHRGIDKQMIFYKKGTPNMSGGEQRYFEHRQVCLPIHAGINEELAHNIAYKAREIANDL